MPKKTTTPIKKAKEITISQPLQPKNYYSAVGRRKSAIARVKLEPGKGEVKINNREFEKYFSHFELRQIILAPLKAVSGIDKFNIWAKISGGGIHGQAEALRHAISRALLKVDSLNRTHLKKLGFLTRDARVKERKKPGLKRARRAPQFSKR